MVMSSEPSGTGAPGDLRELGGQPPGQEDAAGGNAEQHHVVGALGAFDDLVGDAGEYPRDVRRLENGAARLRIVARVVLCPYETDLLPRLTGRTLKDV